MSRLCDLTMIANRSVLFLRIKSVVLTFCQQLYVNYIQMQNQSFSKAYTKQGWSGYKNAFQHIVNTH